MTYETHTEPATIDGLPGYRTLIYLDGVIAHRLETAGTEKTHEAARELLEELVFDAYGICPDCLGSGEGEIRGDDLVPCHCVREARAEERAAYEDHLYDCIRDERP